MEFTANIVLFVPLGLFWFILAPRGWRWHGPLVAFALSVLIELAQHVLLPQRVASPYDVVANGSGALVGMLVAWGALWWREKGRRRQGHFRDAAVAHPPSSRRRPEG
ncbi:VanZ family protein [Arthrobacter sp. CAN_A6]